MQPLTSINSFKGVKSQNMKKIFGSVVLSLMGFVSFSQITVTQTQTPQQLVDNVLTGNGVIITNVTYNYSNPDAQNVQTTIGYFNNNGTAFPITEGVIMGTGDVSLAVGPNTTGSSTNNNGVASPDPSDPDLAAIGTATINNECILEFDFIPAGDTIVFNYIFASEEFPEYSPSSYNDAFGFFISGPGFAGPYSGGAENIAIIPGTTTPVTINNINPTTNQTLYISNAGGADLQYDGHTVTLQASASVICGQQYHIKLAIGDAGDQAYDSAVFLEANSFASNGIDVQIASATGSAAITEACDSAIVTFIRPEDSDTVALTINYGIGGTAINGTDYNNLSGSVTFPIGVDTVQFYVTPVNDGLAEGTETVELSVDIVNSCGDTITTTATIEIIDPQPFNVITTDTTITCPADSIMIQVGTDGGIPVLDYIWQSGGTGNTLWVPALVDGTTPYVVDVTDACGVTSQGTVNVTVNSAPVPTLTFNNPFTTICPGQSATFSVDVVNNSYDPGNETYNWYNPPGLSTTNAVTVSPTVVSWYYVDVFDGCYTVTDSVKVLMGTVDLTAINVVDALNCPGQPTPVLGEIEILPNTAGWQYTITGGGVTTGPQAGNQFTNLTGGITYFINVLDGNTGCSIDTNIMVGTAIAATTADWIAATLDSVTCFGSQDGLAEIQNIQGGLNSGPYDITWTSQIGEITEILGVGTGTGSLNDTLYGGNWVVTVVEQGSGCAWSQTFTIYEPSELIVGFSNSSEPSCFEYNDGDLTVEITGGNLITPGNGSIVISSSDGTILNAGSASLTVNNLVTDTYTVTVIDDKGCQATGSLILNQPGELAIDFTIVQPVCYGIPTGFIGIDTVYNYQNRPSDDSLYYEWVPNPSGNNGIGYNFTNHLGEGTYQLKITDGRDCYKFFDFTITYPDSIYISDIGFTPAICRNQIPFDNGGGHVFAAAAGGSDGNGNGTNFTYTWTEDATGSTTINTTWPGRDPGYYTFVATNDLGCTITETIYVDSLSPEAIFTLTSPEFTSAYEGTAVVNVTITNQSENYAFSADPNADTTFIWTFGFEGETPYISSDINEVITLPYTSEGVYEVCLIVIENLNGCQDTACQEIIIHDFPILEIPNVFTPGAVGSGDGDNVNDNFFFPNTAINEFKCSVYDRWGKQVFQFNSINDQWNGDNMNNNKPCTDGVYFYVYEGTSTNSTEFKGQGNIHLIRE